MPPVYTYMPVQGMAQGTFSFILKALSMVVRLNYTLFLWSFDHFLYNTLEADVYPTK